MSQKSAVEVDIMAEIAANVRSRAQALWALF